MEEIDTRRAVEIDTKAEVEETIIITGTMEEGETTGGGTMMTLLIRYNLETMSLKMRWFYFIDILALIIAEI